EGGGRGERVEDERDGERERGRRAARRRLVVVAHRDAHAGQVEVDAVERGGRVARQVDGETGLAAAAAGIGGGGAVTSGERSDEERSEASSESAIHDDLHLARKRPPGAIGLRPRPSVSDDRCPVCAQFAAMNRPDDTSTQLFFADSAEYLSCPSAK